MRARHSRSNRSNNLQDTTSTDDRYEDADPRRAPAGHVQGKAQNPQAHDRHDDHQAPAVADREPDAGQPTADHDIEQAGREGKATQGARNARSFHRHR